MSQKDTRHSTLEALGTIPALPPATINLLVWKPQIIVHAYAKTADTLNQMLWMEKHLFKALSSQGIAVYLIYVSCCYCININFI